MLSTMPLAHQWPSRIQPLCLIVVIILCLFIIISVMMLTIWFIGVFERDFFDLNELFQYYHFNRLYVNLLFDITRGRLATCEVET